MKRIALFLDGTWNDPESRTNVRRLFDSVDQSHGIQVAEYWKGVGTSWNDRLRGGALGMGLTKNVRDAYEWLVQQYVDGDEIYLFGFSRGAYTARSIAGLIINCGLLRQGSGMSVEDVFARYEAGKNVRTIYHLEHVESRDPSSLDSYERRLLDCSRRVPIKFIGVWDTVGSLGIPWTEFPGIGRGSYYFLNTNISKLIEHAYHALALDEHRAPYAPTLWTKFFPTNIEPTPPYCGLGQTVEQRWFAGAHSNVGGGYGSGDSLSNIPLHWIQEKAHHCGLQFRVKAAIGTDDFKGAWRDSYAEFMNGFYRMVKLGKRYYRPIGSGASRVKSGRSVPIQEVIDGSVFQRYQVIPEYRPANLLAWADRRGVDLSTQVGSCDA